MFTSRAEYRTLLRQDNADIRLTEKGYQLGLASSQRHDALVKKKANIAALTKAIQSRKVKPDEVNDWLVEKNSSTLRETASLQTIVKRPETTAENVAQLLNLTVPNADGYSAEVVEQAVVELKYEDYLLREKQNADKIDRWESLAIHIDFDYDKLKALSFEGRDKLKRLRPSTIGQASRISGVSPSDISILLVYMGR
jgi:tRNA uridine 5-carboxymethylaminomethyl modification enzyme